MRESGLEQSSCELTILMPCLNEAETIEACVRKAFLFLETSAIHGEVLIADNGSTDTSQAIARGLGARVVDVPAKGYGAALTGGIAGAHGRYVIMGDADDSYDFSKLDDMVASLRGGADLVMGNRFRGGIEPGAMPFLHRYLGNPVLSFLGRLFFKLGVGDFHCGLRGFRTSSIRALGLRTTGMEFASEMVVRSAIAGLRIAEVPTTLQRDGRSRKPHLKTWRDGWRHLKFLLMYSPRWLFVVPGGLLVLLGAIVATVLFFGPLRFQSLVIDLNTFIIACLLVMVGMQLLSFGVLARYFAAIAGFLPHSPRVVTMVRHATTDKLVSLAAILVLAGLGFFAYAVSLWAAVNFGPLSSPFVPRMVIASFTFVVAGIQMFFLAFFFGILAIPTKRDS